MKYNGWYDFFLVSHPCCNSQGSLWHTKWKTVTRNRTSNWAAVLLEKSIWKAVTERNEEHILDSWFQANFTWIFSFLPFSTSKIRDIVVIFASRSPVRGHQFYIISLTLYLHCGYRNIVHTTKTTCEDMRPCARRGKTKKKKLVRKWSSLQQVNSSCRFVGRHPPTC